MKIRNNTHKKDIINNISTKTGLPANFIAQIINDTITILISNIIMKKIFKINRFGTFFLKKKGKRVGRNPKNKVNHEISERNVVTFKSAQNIKYEINLHASKQK